MLSISLLNLSASETVALLPAAIPATVACVLPIAALDKDQETMKIVRGTFFGIALLSLLGCFLLVTKLWERRLQPTYGPVHMDFLAQFAAIFVLVSASLAVMQLWDHLHQEGWVKGETLSLLMFSVSGMVFLASTTNFILLFLSLELLSLPLYALTATVRQRPAALEGSMKYFLTGATASCMMLMGIVLIYGMTSAWDFKSLAGPLANKNLDPLLLIGLVLFSVGLFFKISAVPFHQWTPDAYEAAPHPVAAFMSVATKGVALIVMYRFFTLCLARNPHLTEKWQTGITVLAVLTLILGNLTALAQDNVKRMLAYSSISHAGYMLLAFIAGTQQAFAGLLYYLLVYLAMNMGIFGLFTAFGLVGEKCRFRDLQGLGWKRPGVAIPLVLCVFSLAGLPPTGGFFAKYIIFKELIQKGHPALAVLAILCSLVSVYYYLRIVTSLFAEKTELVNNEYKIENTTEFPEASLANASILVCGILSIVMGFAPYLLVDGFALRTIRESLQFGP